MRSTEKREARAKSSISHKSANAETGKRKRIARIVRKLIGKNGEELYFESPEDYSFTLSQLFHAYRARVKEWNAEHFIKWLKPRSKMQLFKPKRKLKKVEEEFAVPVLETSETPALTPQT